MHMELAMTSGIMDYHVYLITSQEINYAFCSILLANRDIIVLQERLEIPLKSRKLNIYI